MSQAIINKRPLGVVNGTSTENYDAVTPQELVFGYKLRLNPRFSIPKKSATPETIRSKKEIIAHTRHLQFLFSHVWAKFQVEYVSAINAYKKKKPACRNIKIGDTVIEVTQPLTPEILSAMQELQAEPLAWAEEIDDASLFDAVSGVGFDSHPVARAVQPIPGRLTGSGSGLRLNPVQNNSFRALNRAWDMGATVRHGDGEYIVTGLGGTAVDGLIQDYALQATRGPTEGVDLSRPDLAIYRPWNPSMDEGWTRWLLEEHGFSFSKIGRAHV